jgi:3-hydroxyacyl-CoA dehydrogenase
MQRLVDEGQIGVKARQGFYRWTDAEIEQTRGRYKADLIKALAILNGPSSATIAEETRTLSK